MNIDDKLDELEQRIEMLETHLPMERSEAAEQAPVLKAEVRSPGVAVLAVLAEGPTTRSYIRDRTYLSETQTGGALLGLMLMRRVAYSDGLFYLAAENSKR